MWSKDFAKALLERAIATGAQALIALLAVDGLDLLSANWAGILSAVGLAMLISALKSIVANSITGDGPSLTHAEVTADTQVVLERNAVAPEPDQFGNIH